MKAGAWRLFTSLISKEQQDTENDDDEEQWVEDDSEDHGDRGDERRDEHLLTGAKPAEDLADT